MKKRRTKGANSISRYMRRINFNYFNNSQSFVKMYTPKAKRFHVCLNHTDVRTPTHMFLQELNVLEIPGQMTKSSRSKFCAIKHASGVPNSLKCLNPLTSSPEKINLAPLVLSRCCSLFPYFPITFPTIFACSCP